jgi:hypothetical protein
MHVFLLFSGTNERAVLALLRAIGKLGQQAAVVARSAADPILSSAYRDLVVAVRDNDALSVPLLAGHIEQTKAKFGARRVTLVPISEFFNTFLLNHKAALEAIDGVRVPLVDPSLYAKLTNKASATDFFAQAGVMAPPEYASIGDAVVPFVAKPKCNVDGKRVLYPVLVKNEADLAAFRASEDPSHYFFQHFVTGRSFYLLAYFARTGEVFCSSQENLAQQPGGKSIVLARTADFHASDVGVKLRRALSQCGYFGFAMIECIVGDDGAYFIEMNPRPWGPLDLCLNHDCGIVEAFVGDWATDDATAYQGRRLSRARAATYLWTGGIVNTWRRRRTIVHRYGSEARLAGAALRALTGDVYLASDSWRIFYKELWK